jgi:hypothetical protein
MDVYASPDSFRMGFSAAFEMSNSCDDTNLVEAEDPLYISDQHIQIKTPRAFETASAPAALRIKIPYSPGICKSGAYIFKTLAFTANQGASGPGSQSLSVLDTMNNGVFGLNPSMPFDPTVVPMSIAYNTGAHPGRLIYATDYHSGNLVWYDASNFIRKGMVRLQDPAAPLDQPRAFELTMSRDGSTMFASHVTSGFPNPDDPLNPGPGRISVLNLAADGAPTLYDVDQDPATTSAGAPPGSGITRLMVKADPNTWIYPLSIKAVSITDGVNPYIYQEYEPFPGEYIFVSGVGEVRCEWNCTCEPGQICPGPIFEPRPAMVAVLDNNPCLYCDAARHPQRCVRPDFCSPGDAYSNPRYWKNDPDHNAYKAMGDGIDGVYLGTLSQALGFSLTSGLPPEGTPLGPTVYMLNQGEGRAYLFHYTQNDFDWSAVMDPLNPLEPFTIATGPTPTDVKVQGTNLSGGPWKIIAYITNAGDDTVYYINTETNNYTEAYLEDLCTEIPVTDGLHYPMSMDTRSDGTRGFVADFESRDINGKSTVSVFNLADPSAFPNHCNIEVGTAPIKIVVQPVPTNSEIFGVVRNEIAFAAPSDFTEPPKQANLIRDWENVQQLEETSTNPQAVISNIDNFQKNMNKWVTNVTMKKNLNEGVNLYRAAYIHEHQAN